MQDLRSSAFSLLAQKKVTGLLGQRRGGNDCIDPKAGDADLWIRSRHTALKKDKKKMSHFEEFVAEGNEKADESANE